MSQVWYAIPSAKPKAEAEKTLKLWRDQGYLLAIWRDTGQELDPQYAQIQLSGPFPGYHHAVNALVREILDESQVKPECAQWIVTGGDDIEPDPNHSADQIAAECSLHFGGTYGVMQPIGDQWKQSDITKICGSPWMGREFCRRFRGGRGPLEESYRHMFGDEEMQLLCQKYEILWQRADLIHYHRHWMREGRREPQYLVRANREFGAMRQIFLRRKAQGFPGHEPLPA